MGTSSYDLSPLQLHHKIDGENKSQLIFLPKARALDNDILVSRNLSHWPLLLLPIAQKSFSRSQFYRTWSNHQCNKYVLVCIFVYVMLWTFLAKDIYGYIDLLNHNNIIWNRISCCLCDFSYGWRCVVLMTWVRALVNNEDSNIVWRQECANQSLSLMGPTSSLGKVYNRQQRWCAWSTLCNLLKRRQGKALCS
jgi:hypothetical protein